MFWADELIKNRTGEELINDSWTPSGNLHMGGLRGPVIHDVIYKALKQKNVNVKYTFGFDDFDPIDGLPAELQKTHEQYLGVPVSIAPSPDGNGSFGDYFGKIMEEAFKKLHIEAEIYKTSELYKKGKFNKAISFVLDHAAEIRKVYEEIYKRELRKDWIPFQVICPKCKKLGTTRVIAWDGKEVSFICEESMVVWAKGCGEKGKISPFDGNGKMPYKVEWPAKWWTFGVTIEGAGKDHMSAGGTHDVSEKIYKDVFKKEPPLAFAYEHFLAGGKKMSSSKGTGLSAVELLEIIPSQIVRFLMIKTKPNQAIEFSPHETDLIPKLYDEYQKVADAYFNNNNDDLARAFELSAAGEIKKPSTIRFSVLAQWVQMPNMEEEIRKQNLEEWAGYARNWVEKFAPEEDKFTVQKIIPAVAKNLSTDQKKFLEKISVELGKKWDAEEFQKELYEWTKEIGVNSKDGFSAIYLSLIGKDHGPKAGWFILSLDKEFVKKRFSEVV